MTPTNTLTLRDDKDKQWQIHKYTNKNCLKDPSCAIYLFKDIKYDIPCNMVDMGMVDMDMDEDNDNEDNDNEDNDNEDNDNEDNDNEDNDNEDNDNDMLWIRSLSCGPF